MRTKNNNKQPSAILTADWHLREDVPVCRKDDFYQTQWNKVDFVRSLQQQYNCPVIHSGDLFDYWKPSPMLLSDTIKHLPKSFVSVYGNHDLPQHNLELKHKSGLYTLEKAGKVFTNGGMYYFCNWGENPVDLEDVPPVLIWHVMTYQHQEPFPGCTAPKAAKLLRKYPQFDLIVTGDNHTPFVEEYDGKLLVNPGSLMRQEANQIDFKPRVYLWYAETNTVKPVFIPIDDNAISRDHLEKTEQRNMRIDAFVSKLNTDWNASLSFEDNLKSFQDENEVENDVMNIVYKAIEI